MKWPSWMKNSQILLCSIFANYQPLFAASSNDKDLIGQVEKLQQSGISGQPTLLLLALALISLLPFIAMMVTSFVKIAVVMSITRQALGTQQAPPNTVITGLAIILSIYVMHPVGLDIYDRAKEFIHQNNQEVFDKANVDTLFKVVKASEQPMKAFLADEASEKNIQLFYKLAYQMRKPADRDDLSPNDLLVLVPAFVISELSKAFQIGFIIFLPFLVVDMAIANILMALGMQMLAPTTIALPFKILLFVMVDGWHLITKGLVLGYHE